jgi:UMF1 family MFS transporter
VKENNKSVWSWALYDFGNSAFATTVIAGFFPLFFKKYWSEGVPAEMTTSRLGWVLGITGLIMAVLAPFWGRKSDLAGHRKWWLAGFALLGIISTAGLAFVPQGEWVWALALYAFCYITFEASLIFYDSLLPYVTEPKKFHRVSGLGYAMGYLGGGILFVLNVLMTLYPSWFGLKNVTEAVQYSFITVSVWWLMGLCILMWGVKEKSTGFSQQGKSKSILETYRELHQTFLRLAQNKKLFLFLIAFWFYIDGVYTVFTMAVDFGLTIGLEQKDLMLALLLVQFVGFPSALTFGKLTDRFSTSTLLLVCLSVYTVVLVFASRITTGGEFMVLACLIGLVQGGIQALSRSYFASLIPAQHSAEYFGFFNVVGRSASFVGPILVGTVTHLTKDARLGLLSIAVLFFLGGFFLVRSRFD